MPFSTKETELLGHLTRRLGSDHEAEAGAARVRIVQLLGRHGFNFNDYAEWLHAGAAAAGHLDQPDPQRENTELRNEVARLLEEAASLRAELSAVRAIAGRQMVVAGGRRARSVPPPAPGGRRTAGLAVLMVLLATLPLAWLLGEWRPATLPVRGEAMRAAKAPRQPLATGAPSPRDPAPAFADPSDPAWRPPPGSRVAVVLEDGMVLSSPFPSRATEQEIRRGTRVAILRQIVANGRQWAEVTSPAASGYLPIDQLDVPD